MQKSIIGEEGGGDVDLCDKKRKVSKNIFTLIGLVAIVFIVIVFQYWQSVFQWKSAVAVASDNSDIANFCVVKESFAKYLYEDDVKISFVKDVACDVKQEAEKNTDADEDVTIKQLEQQIEALVSEYPIVGMVSAISRQDRIVAAFLVGIAKKESDWGKHAPTKNGNDCFNYWGYKGNGQNGNAGGYACFDSAEEAVTTVGNRLTMLVHIQHRDTPVKMLVWKCGSSCKGHSSEGVQSWIGSVEKYVHELR